MSKALAQLQIALKELDDLESLVKLKTGGTKGPTKGILVARRASILLLNAHFEAYLEDVLDEALAALTSGLNTKTLRRNFTTPRPDNINKFFSLLNIEKISTKPSWKKANNVTVRKAIDQLQNTRNAIAHGEPNAKVKISDVKRYRSFVEGFTNAVDEIVAKRVEEITKTRPW